MSAKTHPITVAVVEDDDRVRRSLVAILRHAGDCECVGDYRTGESAVTGLTAQPAKVVVMDVNLPGINGVECVRQLAARQPETQFIILTVFKDTDTIFNALAAGASGYLLKPVRAQQLLAAVRDVEQGGAPMTSSIARQVVAAFQRKPATAVSGETVALSEREEQVLKLLAEGLPYKNVADTLSISPNTLCEYIRRIYRKLHVHSRHDAVDRYRSRLR